MNEILLQEVEPGVLKLMTGEAGPDEITYKGTNYYRFMDFFYIQNKDFDDLAPEAVSNLCRARAKFPHLISDVNQDVRRIFKVLVQKINPTNLLEIGVGKNPIFGSTDAKPNQYILADADNEIVEFHKNSNNDCYNFSEQTCQIPSFDSFFDMAIAVFVLHFPFHINQIVEVYTRIKNSGVVIANVYRRDFASREKLTCDILSTGFKILKVQDSANLCRDHEYWILGKDDKDIQNCASILKNILEY